MAFLKSLFKQYALNKSADDIVNDWLSDKAEASNENGVTYCPLTWKKKKKVDKYDKIEDKQRRNKNDRKEKQ